MKLLDTHSASFQLSAKKSSAFFACAGFVNDRSTTQFTRDSDKLSGSTISSDSTKAFIEIEQTTNHSQLRHITSLFLIFFEQSDVTFRNDSQTTSRQDWNRPPVNGKLKLSNARQRRKFKSNVNSPFEAGLRSFAKHAHPS